MLHTLIQKCIDYIPSQCSICRAWPATTLCEACVNRFATTIPRCITCAMPLIKTQTQCGKCLVSPPPLDACITAVGYDFPWNGCIGTLKFQNSPNSARALAALMHRTPGVDSAIAQAQWLIPIPLAKARLQTRGYNQAQLLAHYLCPEKTHLGLLLRVRETLAQSGLNRVARIKNLAAAFQTSPTAKPYLDNAQVILVDDVMSTGASLFSAALTLRQAGVRHITGLVFARA